MKTKISIAILVIFHSVGLAGILLGYEHVFVSLTPLNLLLTLSVLIVNQHRNSTALWLTFPVVLGFLVEVMGVNTGFPFGSYSYGTTLGPMLLNTPLIIGVNWLILIYGAMSIVSFLPVNEWLKVLTAAVLMVLADLIIEPVAIKLGFWTWNLGNPPLENYVAWFFVSVIMSTVLWKTKVEMNKPVGIAMYSITVAFFLSLFLFYVL